MWTAPWWGVWSSFHSVGRGGRPGKEKDNEKREPEVWRTRRGSCVQHQGGEHGRQWQLAEWACVEEGVMGDNGGALRGANAVVSSRGRRQGDGCKRVFYCGNICMT